jgi:hypothetical protein
MVRAVKTDDAGDCARMREMEARAVSMQWRTPMTSLLPSFETGMTPTFEKAWKHIFNQS